MKQGSQLWKEKPYECLGGIDTSPICLGTKGTEEIISAVKWIQPSFAGTNLEGIAQPKCFEILDTLQQQLEISVNNQVSARANEIHDAWLVHPKLSKLNP